MPQQAMAPHVMAPLIPQKIELPPPDPLDPVSLHDENFHYIEPRQTALLHEDAFISLSGSAPNQPFPLPHPLLY